MSGGHFDYSNDRACRDIYGWIIDCDYGDDGFSRSSIARRLDPLEDVVMSELVWDVFCVLHSYDWYRSGDTCEETYRSDVKRFKERWLKSMRGKRAKEIVDDELEAMRDKLYKAFEVAKEEKERGHTGEGACSL